MSTGARIVGDWVHAHERDHDGVRVFVDAAESLPPSRGRRRLSLRADGSFDEARPGADDRTAGASGTYEFDGQRLVLRHHGQATPAVLEAKVGSDGKSLEVRPLA
jgi:hypothetical protein